MSRRRRKALHVRDFCPGRVEETLGTTAKQSVILARHPLASGANIILSVGVALAYFVAARLSLALLEPVDGVAVFWPAAGVASGILIALGPAARWPSSSGWQLQRSRPICWAIATSGARYYLLARTRVRPSSSQA